MPKGFSRGRTSQRRSHVNVLRSSPISFSTVLHAGLVPLMQLVGENKNRVLTRIALATMQAALDGPYAVEPQVSSALVQSLVSFLRRADTKAQGYGPVRLDAAAFTFLVGNITRPLRPCFWHENVKAFNLRLLVVTNRAAKETGASILATLSKRADFKADIARHGAAAEMEAVAEWTKEVLVRKQLTDALLDLAGASRAVDVGPLGAKGPSA